MYYKDDLLAKDIRELVDIANEIGADATISDKEALVYDILEKQATAEAAKNPLGQKRKRTRIIKKDTDHVYSVNGKEGENFDTKKNKNATSDPLPLFKAVAEGAQKLLSLRLNLQKQMFLRLFPPLKRITKLLSIRRLMPSPPSRNLKLS